MSNYFPGLSAVPASNVVIGSDFDLMKRRPIHESFVGYNKVRDNKILKSH
jgi:hypothetical protein